MPSADIVRQLVRFNLVGVVNTVVDFALFFLSNGAGMPYMLAQTCSYGCGIVNSYICNKFWTFRVAGISAAEMIRFAAINVTALGVSVLLVYLFHSVLNLALVPAKIAATFLTMLLNFFGNRLWVFKMEVSTNGP